MTRVSIAMATYNEADTIGALLDGLHLPGWRVIVVDDNSPDGTATFASWRPWAEVHVRENERGIASAYQLGFILALEHKPDWIVQMDAGGTHSPKDALEMVSLAEREGADLVIGSRFYYPQDWQGIRTGISLGAAALMSLRGVEVSDATTGFRCWRPELLSRVVARPFVSQGFAFQLEALYRAYRCGAVIKEKPVPYLLTNSSFRPAMLIEALRVYFNLGRLYG